MSAHSNEAPQPPDGTFLRHRWITKNTREWVAQCNQIMIEFGTVEGSRTYPDRHQARHRARRLIRLMDELMMHRRDELAEHTEKKDGEWAWSVEYRPKERRDG